MPVGIWKMTRDGVMALRSRLWLTAFFWWIFDWTGAWIIEAFTISFF
jgi:hypothetical protein